MVKDVEILLTCFDLGIHDLARHITIHMYLLECMYTCKD